MELTSGKRSMIEKAYIFPKKLLLIETWTFKGVAGEAHKEVRNVHLEIGGRESFSGSGQKLSDLVSGGDVESRTCRSWICLYSSWNAKPSVEGIPWLLLAVYKKMWVERGLMGELSNGKEAAVGDLEYSAPLQMTTGAQLWTAWSTEKLEDLTVQPLAKTPPNHKVRLSSPRDFQRACLTDPLSQARRLLEGVNTWTPRPQHLSLSSRQDHSLFMWACWNEGPCCRIPHNRGPRAPGNCGGAVGCKAVSRWSAESWR